MSITSLILALLPAIAVRRKPEPDPDRLALEAGYARLSEQVARLMDENARLRAENSVLRDRLYAETHRAHQLAQQPYQNQYQLPGQQAYQDDQLAQYQQARQAQLGQQAYQDDQLAQYHQNLAIARPIALRSCCDEPR